MECWSFWEILTYFRGVTKNKLIGAPRRAAAPPLRAALIFALRRFAAPRFKRQSNFYALCDGCIVMLISQVLPNVVRRQRGRPATRRIDIPSPLRSHCGSMGRLCGRPTKCRELNPLFVSGKLLYIYPRDDQGYLLHLFQDLYGMFLLAISDVLLFKRTFMFLFQNLVC